MDDIRFPPRMSDVEALMWRLERDPTFASSFSVVSVLDRRPDLDRLRDRLEVASVTVPRLRQVVREPAIDVGAPSWVPDAEFDVGDHLRHIALPDPATEQALLDLVAQIAGDPLDRSRPLWQVHVVEGLPDDRAALVVRLHHTVVDGEAAVRIALALFDGERDANPPSPPVAGNDDADARGANPDPASVAADVLRSALRIPLGVAGRVSELLAEPERVPEATEQANATLNRIAEQLAALGPARSPLWTARSRRRHLAAVPVPLDEVRAAAARRGGTVNTAFVTIAAEAAGRYHRELGAPVEELRATMAVSTRTDASPGNAFSVARLLVPTDDGSIDDRFEAVRSAAADAIEEQADIPLAELAALASVLPIPVAVRLAHRLASTVDFATSNVAGLPRPTYVAGAEVLRMIPVGPLPGVAFNITMLSSGDTLEMGLHVDRAAVDRPDLLRSLVEHAAARLVAT